MTPITIEGIAFYQTSDAADYLDVSMALIRMLVKNGTLPAIAVGHTFLIKRDDLDTYKASDRRGKGRPVGATKKASEGK